MKAGFRYYTAPNPPAPYARVTLAAPGATSSVSGLAAQVDTGEFKTVIPRSLATDLGLTQVRELRAEGLDGVVVVLPTYLVEVTIDRLSTVTIETLASQGEPHVLLGRDLLNRYQILLNGPAQELTITEA